MTPTIPYENLALANKSFVAALRFQFDEVVQAGWFIQGARLSQFEKQFAAYCGTSYCAGVGNGSDALALALRSFGFSAGAEVIVPANTCIATILAILNAGLHPVLVEPDPDTCNLSPEAIGPAVTGKTVAVVPVHLYGKCCPMEEINHEAERHGLKVVEDAAQAHGATYKGRKAGAWGHLAAFSFYPTKNLGALGDGGAVTTNRADGDEFVRQMRNYGATSRNEHNLPGVNSRLDELQAAFLSVKLQSLDKMIRHKQTLAGLYHEGLKSSFRKPVRQKDFVDTHHIYHVRHPRRDALRQYLLENGIHAEIHYPVPPHRQNALKQRYGHLSFPITEEIHATTLSLPVSTIHSEKDIERVIDVMNRFA